MSETSKQKKIALVSGANRGIGLAIAIGLAQQGVTVLMGTRNLKNGEAVCAQHGQEGLDIRPVQLDTTDDASVRAVSSLIQREYGRLDILVNNAGIGLDFVPDLSVVERMEQTLMLNVTGTIRLTDALLPLLEAAGHATIVNVSSELGSFGLRADKNWIYAEHVMPTYQASKAAVNSLTVSYAKLLASKGIKVNSICPGYTATDATKGAAMPATRTPEQAARVAIKLALIGQDGPTGTFENEDGQLPW